MLNHAANGVAWLANKLAPFDIALELGQFVLGRSLSMQSKPAPATPSISTTEHFARSPHASYIIEARRGWGSSRWIATGPFGSIWPPRWRYIHDNARHCSRPGVTATGNYHRPEHGLQRIRVPAYGAFGRSRGGFFRMTNDNSSMHGRKIKFVSSTMAARRQRPSSDPRPRRRGRRLPDLASRNRP